MKTLDEIIGQLAGHASMCWSETPTGIFDSTQASKAVDEAKSAILALVPEKKDNKGRMYDVLHKGGYNECRDEILRRFEEGI